MPELTTCQARQYSDQMICEKCGLQWDVNDPEPPECITPETLRRQRGRKALETIKRILHNDNP